MPTRRRHWDPVPVTLPTYVTKEPAARRSVRTIDLDSTGVWTSGRSEIDSALARGAEETEKADKAAREDAAAPGAAAPPAPDPILSRARTGSGIIADSAEGRCYVHSRLGLWRSW